MESVAVLPCFAQPTGKCGIGVARVTNHHPQIDPFRHEPQDHLHIFALLFQMLQRCAFTGGEAFLAALTFQLENVAIFTPVTILDEGMDSRIGNAKVVAQGIETGKTSCVGLLLGTPFAFSVCPWCYPMVDASHLQVNPRATQEVVDYLGRERYERQSGLSGLEGCHDVIVLGG